MWWDRFKCSPGLVSWATPGLVPGISLKDHVCLKKKRIFFSKFSFDFSAVPLFFDPTQLHHHIPNWAWALSVWLGSPSLWCGKPICFRAPCWIWACERERRCDRMCVSGFSPRSLADVLHHRPSLPPSLPPDIQYQGKKPKESAWNRQQDKSDSAVTEISELLDSSQAKL